MAKSYRPIDWMPAPCRHYYPEVMVKGLSKRGGSYIAIFDCKKCQRIYEHQVYREGLPQDVLDILEKRGEIGEKELSRLLL